MNTKAAVLLASLAAALATIFVFVPHNPITLFLVLLTDGTCAALWTAGATALGAFILKKIKVETNPLLFLATAGGLGLGIFSLTALGLGLIGYLNQPTALAMPITGAILFLAGLLARSPRIAIRGSVKTWLTSPAGISWLTLIPVISLTLAAIAASIMPGVLWRPFDPDQYDVVSYHLQVPREWYEAHKILPLSHNVFSYFPMNVEMQYLSLMHAFGGPWRAMYICQYTSLAYAILLVIAIAAESGILAAAILSCVPWLLMLASVAYVESALMLYTALAIIWALRPCLETPRAALRGGFASPARSDDEAYWNGNTARRSDAAGEAKTQATPARSFQTGPHSGTKEIAIAAIMTGLAAGTKITAVPMLMLPILAAILIMHRRVHASPLLSPSPGTPGEGRGEGPAFKNLLARCVLFLVISTLILSPWLLRNFFWATNPIFPIAMNLLGRAHFSIKQVARFRQAHSPTPSQEPLLARLNILWTDVIAHWQFGYILIPLATLAALKKLKDRRTQSLLAAAAVILIVWIGFTHLLARFLVELIPIAALLLGNYSPPLLAAAQRAGLPLLRWNLTIILTCLLAAALSWSNLYTPLTHITADPDRSQLIGRENLTFMIPDELTYLRYREKPIALIGDAGAFLYQIPMSRLHYKTVFDLPGDATDPIEAWAGKEAKNNPNWILVINPTEIARLHKTYLHVPALPPDWAAHGDQPFILGAADTNSNQ